MQIIGAGVPFGDQAAYVVHTQGGGIAAASEEEARVLMQEYEKEREAFGLVSLKVLNVCAMYTHDCIREDACVGANVFSSLNIAIRNPAKPCAASVKITSTVQEGGRILASRT